LARVKWEEQCHVVLLREASNPIHPAAMASRPSELASFVGRQRHALGLIFQNEPVQKLPGELAESHLTRSLFGAMLQRIWALPVPTG
jgi:hypothetical protein